METNPEQELFETKDMFEAVVLMTATKEFSKKKQGDYFSKKISFLFSNPELCTQVLSDYTAGRLEVNARDFVNSYNLVKDMIFSNGSN
jgi:hypothetical protein